MTNGTVVVLGATGKNFAAGMSGGLAFVLDESGDFSARQCNRSMVDLDPLTPDDEELVKSLVRKHVQFTGSKRGAMILERWNELKSRFIKVFPHDYKRVMSMPPPQAQQSSSSKGAREVVHG